MRRADAPRGVPLLAVAILFFAFMLRSYDLRALPPGLFFDESYNILDALHVLSDGYYPVFFAGNNGREPLFIYLQTVFVLFGGSSPFVIRLAATFVGTLTVALTYPLVRRLLAGEHHRRRETVALLACFLLATLHWHLNFSRIGLRAIAQPFFEALALYFLYRGVQELHSRLAAGGASRSLSIDRTRPQPNVWWLWFVLSGAATGLALYTYLSARLLPLALTGLVIAGLCFGLHLTRRHLAGLALLALAFATVMAPLTYYYLQNPTDFLGHSKDVSLINIGGLPALGQNALRIAGMFNWSGDPNWRHNLPLRPVFDPVAGLFFVAGAALVAVRLKRTWGRDALSGYLAMAVVVPVMLLPSLLSEGAPHFLRSVGVLPVLVILPAVGLAAAWETVGCFKMRRAPRLANVLLVAVLAFTASATAKSYFVDWGSQPDPYYHFDGRYVEMADYLKAQDPDVRIYLTSQMGGHATARLFSRGRPYVVLDSGRSVVLSRKEALYGFDVYGVDDDAFAAFPGRLPLALPLGVEQLPDRHSQRSFAFYRVPAGAVPTARQIVDSPETFGSLQRASGLAPGARISFGENLTLLGYRVGSHDSARGGSAEAGAPLPVVLAWNAARPLDDDFTVSLRLLDKQGRVWAQSDSLAGGASYPTGAWQPDEIVLDERRLTPPADLPPGNYRLAAAAYSLGSGRGLEARFAGEARGDLAVLGTVSVAEPAAEALSAMRPEYQVGIPFGTALTLLGYSLDRDGYKAGDSIGVDLFWRVEQDIWRDLAVKIELLDEQGGSAGEQAGPPINGDYPTARWRAGNALRDSHRFAVRAQVATGASRLRVAVLDAATGAAVGETVVAGPALADRPHEFALPNPQFHLGAQFGDQAELLGFSVDQANAPGGSSTPLTVAPGSTLPVRLYWRDSRAIATSYTVFVQVLDAEGKLVAQHDGLPREGAAPTTSWLPQEVVADQHAVPLRPDLPPGEYTLIAGLYNALDGKRLPAGASDFVKLGAIRLQERK